MLDGSNHDWQQAAAQFADHRLVRNHFCYGVPGKLLEFLRNNSRILTTLDSEVLALEDLLARAFDGHGVVGIWNNQPLNNHILAPAPPPNVPNDLLRMWGWTREQFAKKMEAFSPLLIAARTAARAQIGWQLTQQKFIDDHDQLFQKWRPLISRHGIPQPIVANNAVEIFAQTPDAKRAAAKKKAFTQAFCDFYCRWDLTGMSGPYLPLPVQQHAPVLPYGLSDNPYRSGAATVSFPAGVPLPESEKLRTMIEHQSQRGRRTDQMRSWYAIVENSNRNRKNELERHARTFLLLHFWRVVHQHHGEGLVGHKRRLWAVFAEYLEITEDSVRLELSRTRKTLGATWFADQEF